MICITAFHYFTLKNWMFMWINLWLWFAWLWFHLIQLLLNIEMKKSIGSPLLNLAKKIHVILCVYYHSICILRVYVYYTICISYYVILELHVYYIILYLVPNLFL